MEKIEKINNDDDTCAQGKYCIGCCLPQELLVIILSYLPIVDLVSFGCVCKCWLCAYSTFVSQIPSQQQGPDLPWFVLLNAVGNPEHDHSQSLLLKGKFGNLSTQRIYSSIDYDNLIGNPLFLLSKYGWLLLYSVDVNNPYRENTLLFYNIFSRTRIDLPYLNEERFCKAGRSAVFDISAPPTCSDCTVFVINKCDDEKNDEISICSRGSSTWTTTKIGRCGHPIRAIYNDKKWYCLFESGNLGVFDAVNFNWKYVPMFRKKWRLAPRSCRIPSLVSYVMKHGDEVHLHVHKFRCYEVVLNESLDRIEKDESPDFSSLNMCFKDAISWLQQEQNCELYVDSFNAQAWCAIFDDDDQNWSFHWHRNDGSFAGANWCRVVEGTTGCPGDDTCYRVVWLQPNASLLSPSTQPWIDNPSSS